MELNIPMPTLLGGSTPEITFMKDSLQHCWNEVVFWRQRCLDTESRNQEFESKLEELESMVTRCDICSDFNYFVSHHWLPFQLMVFAFVEHPHCTSTFISFPTPSCAGPLYGDGGLRVESEPWDSSAIPSLEPITPRSLVQTDPDSEYLTVLSLFAVESALLPLQVGGLELVAGGVEGGDARGRE